MAGTGEATTVRVAYSKDAPAARRAGAEDTQSAAASDKADLDTSGVVRNPKPAELGFHMPAEWEPHRQAWLGWPVRRDNWRENAVPAQKEFADVVRAIHQFEPVTVCAPSKDLVDEMKRQLPSSVEVLHLPQNDAWFRDTGPTMVVRALEDKPGEREVAGVDWIFNAYGGLAGGLYKDWRDDNKVAGRILAKEGLRRFEANIVLEGGSVHVDGEGTLLTTEECLLNPNRNPRCSKDLIEHHLKDQLGVSKVIWLPRGLEADEDTSGHVDNFACFARPGVVLLAWTDDESDPQHARSVEALETLQRERDARGRLLEVIKVPCPPPMAYTPEDVATLEVVEGSVPRKAGNRLAASYINFYLPNGGLVMPAFGGKATEADHWAHEVLQKAFPHRKVVSVLSREILLGGGNIHCITTQEPSPFADRPPDHA